MTIEKTPFFASLRPGFSSLLTPLRRSVIALAVGICAAPATPLWADEITSLPEAAATEFVSLSPEFTSGITPATSAPDLADIQADATVEIRIKLHGIEDLTVTKGHAAAQQNDTPDTPALTEADELKKQAQTKYLAGKLKKHERTVRQYVDMAWAEASKRDELNPELLIAIIKKESAFRPKVQSPYGAQGLMQVVRRWHRDKLHPSESLFDPEVNIRVGADVLEEYLALADGDINTALRKYSGNARGYANTVLKETRALARVGELAASQAQLASASAGKG